MKVIIKLLPVILLCFPAFINFEISLDYPDLSSIKREPSHQKKTILTKISNQRESYISPHLLIQIRVDKEHGTFKSLEDSEEREILARKEFVFGEHHGRFIDYKVGDEFDEKWSEALARYRYAKDEDEKLNLIKDLLHSATFDWEYEEVDHLIDCSSLQFMNFEEQTIVSFHPTIYVKEGIFIGERNPETTNLLMKKEFDKILERSGGSPIRGVLYAWTPGLKILQYCDVTISQ